MVNSPVQVVAKKTVVRQVKTAASSSWERRRWEHS